MSVFISAKTKQNIFIHTCFFVSFSPIHTFLSPFSEVPVFTCPHEKRSVFEIKSPLLKPFSIVSIFVGVSRCFSVDGRRKRIKKYAILNENVLVWIGPQSEVGILKGAHSSEAYKTTLVLLLICGTFLMCPFTFTHIDTWHES